ncbi:hypothetical protein E8E14_008753 [Neopestalotiopsis sp. 37M]|nr:hypothetical protein E8E14_008753 [Neopestalotiopsis sp. 37M]
MAHDLSQDDSLPVGSHYDDAMASLRFLDPYPEHHDYSGTSHLDCTSVSSREDYGEPHEKLRAISMLRLTCGVFGLFGQ